MGKPEGRPGEERPRVATHIEPGLVIRPADVRDAGDYAEYVQRHLGESGKDGMPVFTPGVRPGREELRDNARVRWMRKLTEPNWGRAWLLMRTNGSGAIVGHVELRGGRIASELHRATLGMGMLKAFTKRGYGRWLLDAATAWAREGDELAWIDLGVFAHNTPAIKLYERYGFVRQFLKVDAFRPPDGPAIDDILMTLKIR